ncbi:MAG: amino acid permease [Planctomycetota bacterium]|jgi:amino acid transporter/mannitol/fructose-specific phosphotransferase system IIA component (Ntr-type)|nr:amino acid permease [Planctomycetota bacterium]
MSTQLSRDLGLFGLLSLSLGAMIGGGVFVLPGLAAAKMGPSVWMAYFGAGLLVLPSVLAKAELATAMPGSGGTYLFVERSLGPLLGTAAGFGVWLVLVLKGSFALVGTSYYVKHLAEVPVEPLALGILIALVLLNCLGVKRTAKLQLGIVVISLVLLGTLTAGGILTRGVGPLPQLSGDGFPGLVAAIGFVFISYAGVTSIASVSEEVARPARDLPLSMVLSLVFMMCLYTLVTLALMATVPWESLAEDKSPMAAFGRELFGQGGLVVVCLVAILALASMANAGVLAASRYPMAMARDGLLPSVLQNMSVRFGTPMVSIVVTGIIMSSVILWVDVSEIAKLASAFQILVFAIECLCVVFLRETKPGWYRPTFQTPLYPFLPAVGIISGISLIIVLGTSAMVTTVGVSLLGGLCYFLYGRRRTSRKGVLQQIARRRDLLPEKGLASTRIYLPEPLRQDLPGAEIVVPLLGREVSSEALVEIAASLACEGERMEILRLREVPPQTQLSAALEQEELHARALERRIRLVAENLPVEIHMDTVVTRDIRHRLHNYACQTHARWVVLEWVQQEWKGFFVSNPLSWWMAHLPCNLALFKDAGNRYMRRIAVHAEPGPHDGLVVETADRLAISHQAELIFVQALPEGAPGWELEVMVDYHDQMGQLCHVETESRIVRGEHDDSLIEELTEYDLLVTGAPSERNLMRLFGAAGNHLFEDAPCSVLQLKTPRKKAHHALEGRIDGAAPSEMVDFLNSATLAVQVSVVDKKSLFRMMSEVFSGAHEDLGKSEAIEEAFWKREQMQNTGIGDGIAIPHATILNAERTRFGAFVLNKPLDYGVPGSRGVELCFATVGPPGDRNTHLKLIGTLSSLLITTDLSQRMRSAQRVEDLFEAFRVVSDKD